MKSTELNTLMHDTADDAVKIADEEFSVELDHSQHSVTKVDDILSSFLSKYSDETLEDSAVFTLCNVFGAYTGEVFRKTYGGEWRYDNSNPDAPYVLLEVGSRSYSFAGICYERLVNDSEVTVKEYFDNAVAQHSH